MGPPEKYVLAMSSVPRLGRRLDAFLLALSYQDTASAVRTKCEALIVAMQVRQAAVDLLISSCLSQFTLLRAHHTR